MVNFVNHMGRWGPNNFVVVVELKTRNITVAKFVTSEFDIAKGIFRRSFIGADGLGYQFIRPLSVDRENQLMEGAIAHDLRHWFNQEQDEETTVVALVPKHRASRPTKWLPEISIARPTRHYWLADRRQLHTRIKDDEDNTYNVFTPVSFLKDLLHAFDNSEASIRAEAFGDVPLSYDQDEVWLHNHPRSL